MELWILTLADDPDYAPADRLRDEEAAWVATAFDHLGSAVVAARSGSVFN